MDFQRLDEIDFYSDCQSVASSLGYTVVEVKCSRLKTQSRFSVVITRPVGDDNFLVPLGTDDCGKVHQILLQRLEVILPNSDIYLEVSTPGSERQIRHGGEFSLFIGRKARIWYSQCSDWIYGKIISCDETNLEMEIDGTKQSFLLEGIAKAKLTS
ncbi:MAG: ribosome maturation factor [Spirochaetaceae bacterium]|nr:ribosome maturation factor [Spirochaetaceae bacterium]